MSHNDVHPWNMVGTWHNTRDIGKINNLAKLKSGDLISQTSQEGETWLLPQQLPT